MNEQEWETAKQNSVFADLTIAVGAMRCHKTGNYQVWISLYGSDINILFASETFQSAQEVCKIIEEKGHKGLLWNPNYLASFILELDKRKDALKIEPFSPKELDGIGKVILDAVQKKGVKKV